MPFSLSYLNKRINGACAWSVVMGIYGSNSWINQSEFFRHEKFDRIELLSLTHHFTRTVNLE